MFLVDLLSQSSTDSTTHPSTDLDVLERSLESVVEMLDRVLGYVQSVLAGETKGNAAVGRYLLDTLGTSTEDPEKGGFNTSLQVCYASSLFPLFLCLIGHLRIH